MMAVMRTWERRPGPFVLKEDGQPFSRPQLSDQWLRERDSNAALAPLADAGLSMHGLRATAVVRLLRAGATTLQIANMVGMSEPMVKRYAGSRCSARTRLRPSSTSTEHATNDDPSRSRIMIAN
jgi:DNA-binding CsgD family transcriptional regulator